MVHILPHWNWGDDAHGSNNVTNSTFPGKVWVHTNGDSAELIVNGQSLGKKVLNISNVTNNHRWSITEHIEWDAVQYAAGNVTAVAYRGGKAVATETLHTARDITQCPY